MSKSKLCTVAALIGLAFAGSATAFGPNVGGWETNSGNAASSAALEILSNPAPAGAITVVVGSTAGPSSTLGPYTMTPVQFPGAPGCTGDVPPIATPLGEMGINPGEARCVGVSWGTWSHGYAGDVYYTTGSTTQTLTMPPNTGAFYFYVEPNPFSVEQCQARAQPGDVSTGPFEVNGDSGARYVGFYDPSGSILSIDVSCTTDFATGEYGIAEAGGTPECDYDGDGDYDRKDLIGAVLNLLRAGDLPGLVQFVRSCGVPAPASN